MTLQTGEPYFLIHYFFNVFFRVVSFTITNFRKILKLQLLEKNNYNSTRDTIIIYVIIIYKHPLTEKSLEIPRVQSLVQGSTVLAIGNKSVHMHRVIKFFGNEWYFKIQRKARDVSSYAYSQRNSIHVCYSSLHLVVRKDFYFFIVIQFLQYKTLANCLRRRHLASYRARLHQPHTSHQAKSVLRQAAPCSSSICVFNVLQLFGTDPKNAIPYIRECCGTYT